MRIIALFLLLFCQPVLAQATHGEQPTDWDNVPTVDMRDVSAQAGNLPYLLEKNLNQTAFLFHRTATLSGDSWLVADLDGDGQDDLLSSHPRYLRYSQMTPTGIFQVLDQFNPPVRFHSPHNKRGFCTLAGPFDLDGDGKQEVVAMGATQDHQEFGFWIVSVPDLTRKNHFILQPFPQNKPDSKWDGHYFVLGTMPGLLADPRQEALILGLSVGFDVYGRGIMAVDPATGDILWHYQTGPKTDATMARMVDLDGDGQKEIVFLGVGPDNIDQGQVLGEFGDGKSRLFALNGKGQALWTRQLIPQPSHGVMSIADFHPQPGLEIAVAMKANTVSNQHLTLWDAQGKLLTEYSLPEKATALQPLIRTDSPRQDLLVSTHEGSLIRWRINEDQFKPIQKLQFDNFLELNQKYGSHPPGTAPITVFCRTSRLLMLLDEDLQPVAALPYAEESARLWTFPFSMGDRSHLLVPGHERLESHHVEILPNPNALPTNPALRMLAVMPNWGWAVLALTLLTLASWWQLVRKHRETQAAPVISFNGDHKREAQLHLLEDLELSGHGAIAPLRSFRRLLWLLDAVKTGIEFTGDVAMRFREIWADCYKDDIPRLLVILDRARTAQLEHTGIGVATETLLKIQADLKAIKESDFALEIIAATARPLHAEGQVAEEALQGLREEAGLVFQTDLVKTIEKVLRANEENLQTAGIQVQQGRIMAAAAGDGEANQAASSDTAPLLCRIDASELGFIVDNLVGNAVRAMTGATERRLSLTWQAVNGLIKLEVRDTGLGIAVEDLDRIMDSPFTTKKRGGMGLPRSQRILRKYGGQLRIKESSPGGGTTFQLLLPRAGH